MRTDIDNKKDEIIGRLLKGESRASICKDLQCKYDTLKSRLDAWGVDLKNQSRKGISRPNERKPASYYLGDDGVYIASHKLKKILWRDGLKQKSCEKCGWAEYSTDGRLPLELDHIDSNRYNNNIENLMILCPNCHALKPGNSGANVGNYGPVSQR